MASEVGGKRKGCSFMEAKALFLEQPSQRLPRVRLQGNLDLRTHDHAKYWAGQKLHSRFLERC